MPAATRFTTEDPVRDGANWFAYAGNNPVDYIDLWGLWDFHGDGTATAQPGDTLWGLAEQVSGSGSNWAKITGYNGTPGSLQVGQTVNYVGMTTVVPTNAYIISGSVYNEAAVKDSFTEMAKILNSQGVPITHDLKIQYLNEFSSNGVSLLSITVGDELYNERLLSSVGSGALSKSGAAVPLVDASGKSFTFIFTDNLYDQAPVIKGIAFDNTTTAILSKIAGKDTGAHEDLHILGLPDFQDADGKIQSPSGNIMGYERYGTQLTPGQSAIARNYLLSDYPKPAEFPSGKGGCQK
jgi:hypothetical protein